MPDIDWSYETSKPAGIYHAEVEACVEKRGQQSGNPYFLVSFTEVTGDRQFICTDILSFSHKAMNMTLTRLKALGFAKHKTAIEASDLVGRRCFIAVKVEHQDGYEPRLIVDISAAGEFRCGYKPEEAKPQPLPKGMVGIVNHADDLVSRNRATASQAEDLNDDIPFAFLLPTLISAMPLYDALKDII